MESFLSGQTQKLVGARKRKPVSISKIIMESPDKYNSSPSSSSSGDEEPNPQNLQSLLQELRERKMTTKPTVEIHPLPPKEQEEPLDLSLGSSKGKVTVPVNGVKGRSRSPLRLEVLDLSPSPWKLGECLESFVGNPVMNPLVQEVPRETRDENRAEQETLLRYPEERKGGHLELGSYQDKQNKPKQRRYRTERPFACPHCPARFTLRSNMERHGKHQHPNVWQRSPSNRVLNKQKLLLQDGKDSSPNGLSSHSFSRGSSPLSLDNQLIKSAVKEKLLRKKESSESLSWGLGGGEESSPQVGGALSLKVERGRGSPHW